MTVRIAVLALLSAVLILGLPCHAFTTTLAGYSQSNSVRDFAAEGRTDSGEYIKATPSWTTFLYRNQWIAFSSYTSRYWESAKAWSIYMVNVTSTNFYIGFLYLYSDRPDFWLYFYEYETRQATWFRFTGSQQIGAQSVNTISLLMPSLKITSEPKYSNRIFIQGPAVSITGNVGRLGDRTVYSLLNLLNVTGQWNELWVLSNDHYGGEYHFVIIYTYYDSSSNVFVGHSLRLNDYFYDVPSRSSLGTWQYGTSAPIPEFPYAFLILLSSVLLTLPIPKLQRRFKLRRSHQ